MGRCTDSKVVNNMYTKYNKSYGVLKKKVSQLAHFIKLHRQTDQKLKQRLKEISALDEVSRAITSTLDLDAVLDLITEKAAHIMRARVCTLRLLDRDKKKLVLRASYGLDEDSILKGDIKVGKSIAGRAVKEGQPYIVNDVLSDPRYYYPQFAKREHIRSLVTVPLTLKKRISGVLSTYSRKKSAYNVEDAKLLSMFASHAAIAIENARLFEETRANFLNTLKVLASVIDAKDSYTHDHSERVMRYAMEIAQELNLSDDEKEKLQYVSFLHDVGKIGVDLNLLRKPGRLTAREWTEMALHSKVGAEIMDKTGFLKELAPVILYHHAKYRGGGYPDPDRKLNRIPLSSRILAVIDAYEAMVSDRPYKKARSNEEAMSELKRCSGTQFDPKIVKAFLRVLKKNGLRG